MQDKLPANSVKSEGTGMFEDDIFVEEMVVHQRGLASFLLSALIVVAAIVISLFLWLVVPFINTVLIIIVIFAAYIAIRFQYTEFEYSFTNGDLDVDKIMAKRKRKRILEINQKQIRVMAPYTAEYESETTEYQVNQVLNIASSKRAAGRWFFIYERKEGGYGFVVLQPSKKLREAMQRYLRSRIKGMES